MSNLGWYQWITTCSKKVGGPKKFVTMIFVFGAGTGAAFIKGCEFFGKKVTKKIHSTKEVEVIYNVTGNAKNDKGLELNIGDTYRVLASDGESILIEIIGDLNSPYFVSADFLRSISDFI